ncbi:MAG: hypothetical protein JW702_00755 [Clostridiales bacterium]|nr:hypothetical protein [Clostridiales bacterium]
MSFKVHKLTVGKEIDTQELENCLNGIQGEVISVIPNIYPKFHLMGATARTNYLVIVERTSRE